MTRRKWQKHFINDVFNLKNDSQDSFSKIIFRNPELIKSEEKGDKLPQTLLKFYSPTSNNILDIRKQRLWLSHPTSFNDPLDCNVGVDFEKYEKHSLLKYIKKTGFVEEDDKQNGFTKNDYVRIKRSKADYVSHYLSDTEKYSSVIFDISRKKIDDFEKEISRIRKSISEEVNKKITKIHETNIRVASFANLQTNNFPPERNDLERMIQMWSHYSDNHKGFCVEYDISSLASDNILEPYVGKDIYKSFSPEDNINLLISAGLFPIIYASNRVSIPKTKLEKLAIVEDEALISKSGIDKILYKAYITKSTKWSYEKEWRIILDGQISSYFNNKIPFPFIKHIYLGSRMEPKIIDDLIEIADDLEVEVTLMELNKKKILLERKSTDTYRWNKEKLSWENPLR